MLLEHPFEELILSALDLVELSGADHVTDFSFSGEGLLRQVGNRRLGLHGGDELGKQGRLVFIISFFRLHGQVDFKLDPLGQLLQLFVVNLDLPLIVDRLHHGAGFLQLGVVPVLHLGARKGPKLIDLFVHCVQSSKQIKGVVRPNTHFPLTLATRNQAGCLVDRHLVHWALVGKTLSHEDAFGLGVLGRNETTLLLLLHSFLVASLAVSADVNALLAKG